MGLERSRRFCSSDATRVALGWISGSVSSEVERRERRKFVLVKERKDG